MGTGIQAATEIAVGKAIALMAADRRLPRTATNLAELAGVGRATLYRAFTACPELRDSFERLVEQSPRSERSNLERALADRLGEIQVLKERLAALTSTVEHLVRDNDALRARLPKHGSVRELNGRRRGGETQTSSSVHQDGPSGA